MIIDKACGQDERLFGANGVRWPFLAKVHGSPLKFFASLVYRIYTICHIPLQDAHGASARCEGGVSDHVTIEFGYTCGTGQQVLQIRWLICTETMMGGGVKFSGAAVMM